MPKVVLLLLLCVWGCKGTPPDEPSSVPSDPIEEWVGDWNVRNPYDANEYFRGADDDAGSVTFSSDGTWSLFATQNAHIDGRLSRLRKQHLHAFMLKHCR